MIGSVDAVVQGGRHSRHLMNAQTERLPVLSEVLTWFSDDDPEATDTDIDTDALPALTDAQVIEPVRKQPLPWDPPPRDVMEQVLEGLKRMTWDTTPEGDEPDETDNQPNSRPDD